MSHLLHADAPVLGHERQRGHELAETNSSCTLQHQTPLYLTRLSFCSENSCQRRCMYSCVVLLQHHHSVLNMSIVLLSGQ